MQKDTWFGMRADKNDIEQIKTLARLLGLKDSQAVRFAITFVLKCVPEIPAGLNQNENARGVDNVTD
ncbi:MAG TPA: hypothetical protein VK206_21305 [Anaerolineales bacterium]|nr:hypothetical protein [Anaerolineales bacterium]